MAESAAYARRTTKGGCAATTIPAGLNAGATTATLADGSTWAGGVVNGNTRVMLNRAGATPEEAEVSAISGNDITFSARGLQGTSDTTHAAGVSIEVIHSPRDFDEANYWVAKLGAATAAAGDLMYADGDNSLARLAKGTARQQLAMNAAATAPEWVASIQSLLTATGDIVYASAANTPARLAAGTSGYVLTSGGAGVAPSWAAAASGWGTPVVASVATSQTTTSDVFTDLATVGPAVTVTIPASGKALIILSARVSNTGGAAGYGAIASVSGAGLAADVAQLSMYAGTTAATDAPTMSYVFYATGLTPGSQTYTMKYRRDNGGTATFVNRQLTVIPIS